MSERSPIIKKLIHKIGLEFWLTDAQAEEVIMSQFKFLRKLMMEGDSENSEYTNFRLPKFGLFSVSEKRKHWEQNYRKKYDERNEDDNIHAGGTETASD